MCLSVLNCDTLCNVFRQHVLEATFLPTYVPPTVSEFLFEESENKPIKALCFVDHEWLSMYMRNATSRMQAHIPFKINTHLSNPLRALMHNYYEYWLHCILLRNCQNSFFRIIRHLHSSKSISDHLMLSLCECLSRNIQRNLAKHNETPKRQSGN